MGWRSDIGEEAVVVVVAECLVHAGVGAVTSGEQDYVDSLPMMELREMANTCITPFSLQK